MLKLVQPREEMRTRPVRKKFIILTDPREESQHTPIRATGHDASRRQKAGVGARATLRAWPLLWFPQEKSSKAS